MFWELGIGKAIVGAIARKVVDTGISLTAPFPNFRYSNQTSNMLS
jgi:hypothetical protein